MKTYEDYGFSVPSGTSEVAILCPKCSSSRKKKTIKTLFVNRDKRTWYCHHCQWTGGLGSLDYMPPKIYAKPVVKLSDIPKKVRTFFENRKIPLAVLEKNKISGGSYYFPQSGKEEDAIMFPFFRDGEIVNCKYRGSGKKFGLEKGAERILYGLDYLFGAKEVVICEGEIDALSFQAAGFTAVSVPNGASVNLSYLESDADLIEKVESWIIAVDNDEAGRKLELELARRLGIDKCKKVIWGEEKDANELLVKQGAEAVKQLVSSAVHYPIEGLFTVKDCDAEINDIYENGLERGVTTGWDKLDPLYSLRPGELTVVTGIPGAGKSNFIDALMVNIAKEHGWNHGIFSPENQPIADHMARMIEKVMSKSFDKGNAFRLTKEQLEDGKVWVNSKFTWILPNNDAEWTVESILTMARSLVLRKGITGLVIDPWNELEHQRHEGMTETEYIGQCLKHIRQFARQNRVHIWLIAHPTKLRKQENGDYPVPTAYDISGSSNWRNKADNVLVVWRNYADRFAPVEIYVQKIRFKQNGRIGTMKLAYNENTGEYTQNGI